MNKSDQDFLLGDWIIRPSLNRIENGSVSKKISPKFMQLLVVLARRPGELFTRDELLNEIWPDVHVVDAVLTRAISELRQNLEPGVDYPEYIETIPKSGYRLTVAVKPVEPAESPPGNRTWFVSTLSYRIAVVFFVMMAVWLWFRSLPDNSVPHRSAMVLGSYTLTQYAGEEFEPNVSPDGRYLAFTRYNPDFGDYLFIEVLDQTTGQARHLSKEGYHLRAPVWSHDGLRLAYLAKGSDTTQIAIADALEESPSFNQLYDCEPCANGFEWGPADRSLLISRTASDGRKTIEQLDLASGQFLGVTFPDDAESDNAPALSPDGNTLAFIRTSLTGWNIVLKQLNGGEPTSLLVRGESVSSLDWSPDSKFIFFLSAESLWRVPVDRGEEEWLTLVGQTVSYLDVDRANETVVLSRALYDIDLHELDLADPHAGTTSLVNSAEVSRSPRFSPSGDRLAYIQNQPNRCEVRVKETAGLFDERLGVFDGICRSGSSLKWSPSGRNLLLTGAPPNGGLALVAGGSVETIVDEPVVEANWIKDGSQILIRRPMSDGSEYLVWSLASSQLNTLRADAEARDHRAAITTENGLVGMARWTPAGYVYVERVNENSGRVVLKADNEEMPQILSQTTLPLFNGFQYDISPDRTKAVFTAQDYVGSDLIVIKRR